jgi:transcription-repair coupling factor (superfamily II helicase)
MARARDDLDDFPHNRHDRDEPRARTVKPPGAVPTLGLAGEIAIRLLALHEGIRSGGLLHVASSERRAARIVTALRDLAPTLEVALLPPWDCLPYDRASPSREVMGRRIAALAAFARRQSSPIVITTPPALLQRVPPQAIWDRARIALNIGDALSLEATASRLRRIGYVLDDRVDEAGEAAIRGQVIDIFPAGADGPVRIEHEDGRITAIRTYDAATQLTSSDLTRLVIVPASESVVLDENEPFARSPGVEHRIPDLYGTLDTLFDYLPGATVTLDPQAAARVQTALAQVSDAYESRSRLRPEREDGPRPIEPRRLYLDEAEWENCLAARTVVRFEQVEANAEYAPVPSMAGLERPFVALGEWLRSEIAEGQRVVLAAASEQDLQTLVRHAARALGCDAAPVPDWASVQAAAAGRLLRLPADIDRGFRDPRERISIVTARDLLGSRAQSPDTATARPSEIAGTEIEFRFGDAVIHLEHGLGLLSGSETLEADGSITDLLRLTYADDTTLLVPVEEMNKVWRYGSAGDELSLDRLDGDSWQKRRAKVKAEIAETARRLVDVMRERESATTPRLVPPRAPYERFVAGFPYAETADQLAAIEDTLEDLASGRPMNRLVCGDVGFGKTEVALRAAAAAVLAGKQVAIAAPTTVLVRQHVETFTRRFAGLGIEIAHLSRLVTPGEARKVKDGLASGTVRIVVGTHALAGKGVRFKDLGLVIVDEEQRFGAAHKDSLRALGSGVHVLTLTATPIPRTLQAALVGLQDLSVIATPPARRQPIRTFLVPFDEATLREALLREQGRGGQSFVVCPRVDDIEPMNARLTKLVPELVTFVAHGKMPAQEIDDVMVRFADGEGDVLLATNIIESGLDVPRANTMLVWRPDRFGVSQLHQLRGRVGRGRLRGVAYLMTEPDRAIPRATRKRLETLESLDRLGAGFAISARDLDQRGAGDLLGEEQAGHMKLIGVSLYHDLLQRSLAIARDGHAAEEWTPELNVGLKGFIPEAYVPEAEVRISLYARIAKLDSDAQIDALASEIEDRFGAPPEPVDHLLMLCRLKQQCRTLDIQRVDAGPQAVAVTLRDGAAADRRMKQIAEGSDGAIVRRGDRLVWAKSAGENGARLENAVKMLRFIGQVSARS